MRHHQHVAELRKQKFRDIARQFDSPELQRVRRGSRRQFLQRQNADRRDVQPDQGRGQAEGFQGSAGERAGGRLPDALGVHHPEAVVDQRTVARG